jgi:hypothetical protein
MRCVRGTQYDQGKRGKCELPLHNNIAKGNRSCTFDKLPCEIVCPHGSGPRRASGASLTYTDRAKKYFETGGSTLWHDVLAKDVNCEPDENRTRGR